jgi:chlorobactene glucosyltransferase
MSNNTDINSIRPFVSVLIPARNEEINIENCITSIMEQDYFNYEVLVLNDNSVDRTNEILTSLAKRFKNLKIVQGESLPEGWSGKCFACYQLSLNAKGDYLLFTDADTTHQSNSIRKAIEIALAKKSDLFTFLPKMEMKSFGEKLIMPLLNFTIFVLLPFYFIDKKYFSKVSIGMGPFMLFRRGAYDIIGGHESVKDALVEDVWLGRKIKEHKLKLIIKDGTSVLKVRMYRNFKGVWKGFSKNIYAGFQFSTFSLFTLIIFYMILFVMPFAFFIAGYLYEINKFISQLLLVQVTVLYLIRTLLSLRFKLGFISTLLHPIGAFFVPLIAFNSWMWIKFGNGAKWKGRIYKIKNNTINKTIINPDINGSQIPVN